MSGPAEERAPSKHWPRKPKGPPLAAAEARRQGEVTRLAFVVLGREDAIQFLNAANTSLGGQPLALAIGSSEGFNRVETELARLAYEQPRGLAQ